MSETLNSDLVDEFYFSALHDHDELFPISDELYAEELQLQEALISSSSAVAHSAPSSSSLPTVFHQNAFVASSSSSPSSIVASPSSSTCKDTHKGPIFCNICMDTKTAEEMFTHRNICSHSFCQLCISRYIASKIQENIATVKCPDVKCTALIGPELCHSMIPNEVLERWENALCEALVLGSQKFNCPCKDCQAMLVDDGEEVVTVSECPSCRRLFCAQCKVVWHSGMDCREYGRLNKNEREREHIMLLMELAKMKKWRRCPSCKFYVEKKDGCMHILAICHYFIASSYNLCLEPSPVLIIFMPNLLTSNKIITSVDLSFSMDVDQSLMAITSAHVLIEKLLSLTILFYFNL